MRWWRRGEREQDLERELRSDLELEASERQDEGLSAQDAGYAARRAFGSTTLVTEEIRNMSGWSVVDNIGRDLRYAGRRLRRSPAFTVTTVLTLAIGIGANAIMFSIINNVLWKPLPYPNSERLVDLEARDAQGQRQYVSQPDLDDWRAMTQSFTGLASWAPQSVNLTGVDRPERTIGMFVSANFFPVIGITPMKGRNFAVGEDRIGGERVATLSGSFWHSRFGSDPSIVGRAVQLNGEPYTIVGVLPPSFVFPLADADVYLPAHKYPNYSMERGQTSCAVLGKLREGQSIWSAQSEVGTVTARLSASYPATNKGKTAVVTFLRDDMVARRKPSVLVLAGSVVFVLLIVCANVAGLLIARMISRERERAVRTALGASRLALIREIIIEAFLLSLAGGASALLLVYACVPPIASAISVYLPNGTTISADLSVVTFTFGLSVLAALVIACIPALQSSKTDQLRSSRGAGSAAASNRARNILVTAEIALALVLLIGAGLMIKSFSALGRVEPGFDAGHLLTLVYRVPKNKYATGEQQAQFHQEVVAKLKAMPGVLGAASVRAIPLGGNGNSSDFFRTDLPAPAAAERPQALLNFADPDFFSTLRIPLLRGRTFSQRDQAGSSFVIVINQTLAKQYFSDTDPIGRLLQLPQLGRAGQIVGVIGDVKHYTSKIRQRPKSTARWPRILSCSPALPFVLQAILSRWQTQSAAPFGISILTSRCGARKAWRTSSSSNPVSGRSLR